MRNCKMKARDKVLRALEEGPRSTTQIARGEGITPSTAIKHLYALEEEGIVWRDLFAGDTYRGRGRAPISWRLNN
jgi:predicted ArsR family transcriptional regulator